MDTIGEAVAALSGRIPVGCELHLNDAVPSSISAEEDPVSAVSFVCCEFAWLGRELLVCYLLPDLPDEFIITTTTLDSLNFLKFSSRFHFVLISRNL